MPPRNSAPGHCELCNQPVDKSRLVTHLEKCLLRHPGEANQPVKGFLIEVKALPYWLAVLARADAQLSDLDDFLRAYWVECCGHLSAFTIDTEQYGSTGFDEDDEDLDGMIVPLDEVLSLRQKFGYDYDFGMSTSLELKVLAEPETRQEEPIQLLAQNDAPVINCQECGKPATLICSECIWEGEGALCNRCAPAHPCEQDALRPIVNSPRCGICEYTGPEEE